MIDGHRSFKKVKAQPSMIDGWQSSSLYDKLGFLFIVFPKRLAEDPIVVSGVFLKYYKKPVVLKPKPKFGLI